MCPDGIEGRGGVEAHGAPGEGRRNCVRREGLEKLGPLMEDREVYARTAAEGVWSLDKSLK